MHVGHCAPEGSNPCLFKTQPVGAVSLRKSNYNFLCLLPLIRCTLLVLYVLTSHTFSLMVRFGQHDDNVISQYANFMAEIHHPHYPVDYTHGVMQPYSSCEGEGNMAERVTDEELITKQGGASVVRKYFGYKQADTEQTRVICKECKKLVISKGQNASSLF